MFVQARRHAARDPEGPEGGFRGDGFIHSLLASMKGIRMHTFTLWLFNIAMENGPFIDGFPINTWLIGDMYHIQPPCLGIAVSPEVTASNWMLKSVDLRVFQFPLYSLC